MVVVLVVVVGGGGGEATVVVVVVVVVVVGGGEGGGERVVGVVVVLVTRFTCSRSRMLKFITDRLKYFCTVFLLFLLNKYAVNIFQYQYTVHYYIPQLIYV